MYACFLENLCALGVHVVALTENNLSNADLDDLDAARQTWTTIDSQHKQLGQSMDHLRVAVQHSTVADTLSTCLEKSVLLGMETQTCAQPGTTSLAGVATSTSALIAICDVPGSTIVASADDTLSSDKHTSDLSSHAITSSSSKIGKLHKILVPGRSHSGRIEEV